MLGRPHPIHSSPSRNAAMGRIQTRRKIDGMIWQNAIHSRVAIQFATSINRDYLA